MRVYNRRRGFVPAPEGAVYVGRPTQWGNPFPLTREEDRDDVLARYREWVQAPERAEFRTLVRRELRGRDLVCWCAPRACHADVLIEIANEP